MNIEKEKPDEDDKIFVIGLDGATFDILDPWIREGKLPVLAKLMSEGVSCDLISTIPPVTAAAWPSFMTGKNPGKHGLFGWMQRIPNSYELSPINSKNRHGKAIWEILSGYDRQSIVINVPITYPPSKINGFIITGFETPHNATNFTYPLSLKDEIKRNCGEYTIHISEVFSPSRGKSFLKNLYQVLEQRAKTTKYLMQKYDWDFLMVVFNGTDRIQHELWKYLDPKNPQYDKKGAEIYTNAILDYYKEVDKVLGQLLHNIDENTVTIIMSDHGAGSLHKFIYVNSWLLNNGLLKLKSDLFTWIKFWMFKNGFSPINLYKFIHKLGLGKIRETVDKNKEYRLLKMSGLSFSNVNWTQTNAYSIGGQIFLNVKGREPEGIINPGEEYNKVRNYIIKNLYQLKDPESGKHVIGKIFKKEEIYFGECFNVAPDLTLFPKDEKYVVFSEYEFGSKSPIGRSFGISGWHRMNGIFIMKGKNVKKGVKIQPRNIIDIAPTVFFVMDLPIPKDIDGKVIKDAFSSTFLKLKTIKYSEIESTTVHSEFRYSKKDKEEIEKRLRDMGYI